MARWSKRMGSLRLLTRSNYSDDLGTDTINNIGLVIAGNNKEFCATKSTFCVSDSSCSLAASGCSSRASASRGLPRS